MNRDNMHKSFSSPFPFSRLQKSDPWETMDQYTNKMLHTIEDEENDEEKRIHQDHTKDGVPAFVGEYEHDIDEHEEEMEREFRRIRQKQKKEARRNADSESKQETLDRMARYSRKEMDIVKRNERKERRRIEDDHESPGVPKSVRRNDHDYDQHSSELKSKIRKLQNQERADVASQFSKSEKKKRKKKYPSFDVQSRKIAAKEGVSQEDADAMLASRARNHGTKKSLSEMSLVEIYNFQNDLENMHALTKRLLNPNHVFASRDVVVEGKPIPKQRKQKPSEFQEKESPAPSPEEPYHDEGEPTDEEMAQMMEDAHESSKPQVKRRIS